MYVFSSFECFYAGSKCFVCIITVLSPLSTADHQGDGCMDKIMCYVEEA